MDILDLNIVKYVLLKILFVDKYFVFGVFMSCLFGKDIDNVINISYDVNIILRFGCDILVSLIYMFNKKWIDILFGYFSEYYYLVCLMGFEDEFI